MVIVISMTASNSPVVELRNFIIIPNSQNHTNNDPSSIPDQARALSQIAEAQEEVRTNWSKAVKNVFIGEFSTMQPDALSTDSQIGEWPDLTFPPYPQEQDYLFRKMSLYDLTQICKFTGGI